MHPSNYILFKLEHPSKKKEEPLNYKGKKVDLGIIPVILKVISRETNFSEETILSKTRKREIVTARQLAMALSCKYTIASLSQIGKYIGNKDHATVSHAKKTINNLYETDKKFQLLFNTVDARIHMFITSAPTLVCEICGGTNVMRKVWFDPNTTNYIRPMNNRESRPSDHYCNDCCKNTKLILETKYEYGAEEHISNDEVNPVETLPDKLQAGD